jgi:hypothetical protein
MKSANVLLCGLLLTAASLPLAVQAARADSALTEVCKLPKDSGPCYAYIRSWFHNPQTDRCEPFVYGGCMGNGNNFRTKEACEAACPAQPEIAPMIEHARAASRGLPRRAAP